MATPEKDSPPESQLRINRLTLTNYKGIDHLELEFPAPTLPGDADVTVIGSENGMGKTSVLESIVLSMGLIQRDWTFPIAAKHADSEGVAALTETVVRAGCHTADILANVCVGSHLGHTHLTVDGDNVSFGLMNVSEDFRSAVNDKLQTGTSFDWKEWKSLARQVLTPGDDPFIDPLQMYFHSYRRVTEANLLTERAAGRESNNGKEGQNLRMPSSEFKRAIARAMMGKAGVLSSPKPQEAQRQLDQLKELLKEYALVEPTQLHDTGQSLEPLVRPLTHQEDFRLDGLSSGQKELVSLLFSVWLSSLDSPKVVLIDEPELHLNAQWHRKLVRWLTELAPENQYILATHSDEIFGAVDPSHRILLKPAEAGTNA